MPVNSPHRASEPGPYAKHIPALDGLRGLAILGVVASHLFIGTPAGPWSQAFHAASSFGAHGVDLFFVLSGFLITGILYDSLGDPGYFRKFYARRSLRIFPLYYGVLLVLFLLTPMLHLHWHHMEWVLLGYLQNTDIGTPFYEFTPGRVVYLDHFWSLAVEEQFYLVWPLLIFLLSTRDRILRAILGLSIASLLIRTVFVAQHVDYNVFNRSTLCRADSLLIGAGLALLLRSLHHDRVLRLAPAVLVLSSALFFALLALANAPLSPQAHLLAAEFFLAVGYTLLAFSSAALIGMCLRPGSRTAGLFSLRALRFYGKYSYGLYVLHAIALPFLIPHLRHWFESYSPNKYLSIGGSSLIIFLGSTLAAVLSYNLYEKQFLRLKRFFNYDRRSKPRPVMEPVNS